MDQAHTDSLHDHVLYIYIYTLYIYSTFQLGNMYCPWKCSKNLPLFTPIRTINVALLCRIACWLSQAQDSASEGASVQYHPTEKYTHLLTQAHILQPFSGTWRYKPVKVDSKYFTHSESSFQEQWCSGNHYYLIAQRFGPWTCWPTVAFLCWVCMLFPCLHRFPSCAPVSYQQPKD